VTKNAEKRVVLCVIHELEMSGAGGLFVWRLQVVKKSIHLKSSVYGVRKEGSRELESQPINTESGKLLFFRLTWKPNPLRMCTCPLLPFGPASLSCFGKRKAKGSLETTDDLGPCRYSCSKLTVYIPSFYNLIESVQLDLCLGIFTKREKKRKNSPLNEDGNRRLCIE
jgi:hypothetical protein